MATRREVMLALGAVLFGSGAATAATLSTSVSAEADLRVVVRTDLRLVPGPGRDEDDGYYELDDDGQIEEFIIEQLNQQATTWFEQFAELINQGDVTYDAFEFTFRDGDDEPIGDQLKIISEAPIDRDNGTATVPAGEETVGPGDDLVFGFRIDLLEAIEAGDTPIDEIEEVVLEIDPVSTDHAS